MEEQALVIAMVGVLGIGAQWIAWRTGWPAIVLMLAAGFLAGPVFHIIDPEQAFGPLLDPMISIGVALILFEGGLSLNFREFRKVGASVTRLAIIGVPLGWFLGSMACHYIAGLAWPVAILFAGILVVTGPTVVIPLLRQSSIQQRPAGILKWEGIVNDPAGALCAVIAYEYFRMTGDGSSLMEIVPPMLIAAGLSALLGYAAANAIAWSFPRGFVPEYLKVPVLLVTVIGVFVLSNRIEHEAGLIAVTVMGIAIANMHVSSLRSIHPFKQNVAVLLVSGIFILLSASLEFESLRQLELRYGLFLLALLFLVRPATILVSLLFSDIPWNERLFLAWIAPRGIVLVAISGLFALRLTDIGYDDGAILVGLSFAVVVTTIVAHGFTIDLVARWLGVKGETRPGVLIVGSTPWSGALANQLAELDIPVTIADSSFQRLASARQRGVPTYHGEILNEATEHNLDLAPFQILIAAADNEAYNALVCSEFAFEIGRDRVYQLGEGGDEHDPRALPASLTGRALFASGMGVEEVNRDKAEGWVFRRTRLTDQFSFENLQARLPDESQFLMVLRKDGQLRFFTHASNPEPSSGDVVLSYTPPDPPEQIAAEKAAERNRKGPAPESG